MTNPGNDTASPFDLDGKKGLITGSSQGISFALARGLAKVGAEIILNGRSAGNLAAVAEKLRSEGAVAAVEAAGDRARHMTVQLAF